MAYKNNLKEPLMSEKITDSWTDQSFKLSYDYYETEVELEDKKENTESKSNLDEMTEQNIRDYISNKYIQADEIEMENLIKDLIILKGYKTRIEERLEFSKRSWESIAFCFAIFAAILSVNFKMSDNYRCLAIVFLFCCMFKIPYDIDKEKKEDRITYGILRTLNYAISILEAIKEDVYANPEKVIDVKDSNKEIEDSKKDITKNINSNNISENLEGNIIQQNEQTENKLNHQICFNGKRDSKHLSKKFLTRSFKLAKKEEPLKWSSGYKVIYNYFADNYLNGYDKDKDANKLLDYDLMILKTYRDYIESIEKNNDYLINCLILLISIIGIFLSLIDSEETIINGVILIISYFAFVILFYVYRTTKLSGSYKIRVCNKIIYKLEDLK